MTKKEMTEIFSVMMLAWPNAEMFRGGIQKLAPTISLWTTCLSDVDFWTAQQAVVRLCQTCKFPPTIAEMKEQIDAVNHGIENEIRNTFMQARNYVRHYPGDLAAAYERMTPKCQRVIDEMGGMEKFVPPGAKMVNMEQFERIYERMLRSSNALTDGNSKSLPAARKEAT